MHRRFIYHLPRGAKIVLWLAVIPITLLLILHQWVLGLYLVQGKSMEPTIRDRQILTTWKLGKLTSDAEYIPNRFQIVTLHYPKDPSKQLVKRVVGVPGDRIIIKDGRIDILVSGNTNLTRPDYSFSVSTDNSINGKHDEIVKNGHVYVLGDSTSDTGSFDSRQIGQIPSRYLNGNVIFRIWPIGTIH